MPREYTQEMRDAYNKAKLNAEDMCWQWLPLIDYTHWDQDPPPKIAVDPAAIDELNTKWTQVHTKYAIFGIYVPAIAKFPAREVLSSSPYWYDVLSLRDDRYIVCNKAAFYAFMPFAILEHSTIGTPVIFFT